MHGNHGNCTDKKQISLDKYKVGLVLESFQGSAAMRSAKLSVNPE